MKYNAEIKGIGSYLPEKIITNQDIVNMGVETSDEWIYTRIGIKQRHASAEDEDVHHLASKAIMKCLAKTEVKIEDIDLIISLSTTPNYFCPATACLIQKEIGAKNAAAFDMNSVCSDPIVGIETAAKFVRDGTYENIIVVTAEAPTKDMDWKHRETSVFFGDGAAALLIGRGEEEKILSTYFKSDGSRGHVLVSKTDDKRLFMDGRAIFEFATEVFPESIKKVCEKANITLDEIKMIISHQANHNIIKTSMEKLGLPMEKTHIVIEKTGNTIGASVLITLDEAIKLGKIKKGDLIAIVAFGGGLSWGANLIRW